MFKVIVERPRHDHRGKWARLGRSIPLLDADDQPLRARVPMNDHRRSKRLNENLAPLRRYLVKQINRPWNKVYSEICENLKTTSTVQQHVRDHIEDFVAIKTRLEGGQIRTTGRWGGDKPLTKEFRELYVHPRTGLLKRNPHFQSWKKHRQQRQSQALKERDDRMRVVDEHTQFHRLKDGTWWEVTLAKRPDGFAEDVVLRSGLSKLPAEELYGRRGVYAVDKRQLSKADKKRHGLR